mgnify:CR=1 FL=1
MKQITNLSEARHFAYILSELRPIARRLHNLHVQACNVGLTPRQEKREVKLMAKAQNQASYLDLVAYRQGDPRGACPIYLVEKGMDGSNYNEGIGINGVS